MSIDIDLTIDTGQEMSTVVYVGNYTHNTQPMWRTALREGAGVEMGLCDFDGWQAQDALPLLEKAVAHMSDLANRDVYTAMNPSNKWGNYEGALEYLNSFQQACEDHPLCTISTSC